MRKLVPALTFLLCALTSHSALAQTTTEKLKATFDSGVAAYDAGDYPTAFKIWSSIDDDDVAAMRNVAIMMRKGQGVAKNPKAAEDMFERAADAGLSTAMADLADMLLKGEAGPPDPQAALPLLQAAAAANHPVAEYELGQMYETGQLVPKDLDRARTLYAAAASHGMPDAQAKVAALGPPTAPSPQAPAPSQAPAAPAPP